MSHGASERRGRWRQAAAVLLAATACSSTHPKPVAQATPALAQRTCLVLSVGGPQGLAQLGAITAVQVTHTRIDCVVGTSMGALTGSLYATEPREIVTFRYKALLARYAREGNGEAVDLGALGALLGAGLAVATGGASILIAEAAVLGGIGGIATTQPLKLARFKVVLNDYYGGASIQGLPLMFGTLYKRKAAAGYVDEDGRSGVLAAAVSNSIANPFIFKDINVETAGFIEGTPRRPLNFA
jgi:NTE family protein